MKVEKIILEELCTEVAKIQRYRKVKVVLPIAKDPKGAIHKANLPLVVPTFITDDHITATINLVFSKMRKNKRFWKKPTFDENTKEVTECLLKTTQQSLDYMAPSLENL